MHGISLKTRILSRKMLYFYLLCAVICTCIALFFFVKALVKPTTGLVSYYPNIVVQNDEIIFQPREIVSPAMKAGLQPGDRIISIDEIEIKNARDIINREYDEFSFDDMIITVERKGKLQTFVVHPEHMISRYDWFFFLVFLVILCIASFFLIYNYHSEKAHLVSAFLCQLFLMYSCSISFGFQDMFSFFIVNIGEVSALLFISFFLFLDTNKKKGMLTKLFHAGVFLFTVFLFSIRYIIFVFWIITSEDLFYQNLVWMNQIQGIIDIGAYSCIVILLIIHFIRTNQHHIKKHIEWIIAGTLLSIPPHFIFNQLPYLFPGLSTDNLSIGNTSYLFLSFLPLFYIIGIVKSRGNRLLVFSTRIIFYIVTAFISLAFFSLMYFPFQDFFLHVLNIPDRTSGFIIALLLFLATLYIQFMLFMIIERYFVNKQLNVSANPQQSRENSMLSARDNSIAGGGTDLILFTDGIKTRVKAYLNKMQKMVFASRKKMEILEKNELDPHVLRRLLEKDREQFNAFQESVRGLEKLFDHLSPLAEKKATAHISVEIRMLIVNAIREIKSYLPDILVKEPVYIKPLRVFCSPEEIVMSIMSVLRNAWEAQVEKLNPIEISITEGEKIVSLQISDSGEGIRERYKHLIGQPFFSTKKNHEGLELFISKIVLEKNNGSITYFPNKETGTTAVIELEKGK